MSDDQAKRVARADLAVRVFVVCTAVAVVAILALVAWTLVSVRHTQLEGTPLGKKLAAQADTIQDCTTPEGECYKRGQERTRAAVSDINRVVIIAAACSAGLPNGLTVEQRESEIQACVIDRLAKQARKP